MSTIPRLPGHPESWGFWEGELVTRLRSMIVVVAVAGALLPGSMRPAEAQLPPPGAATTWLFAEGNTLPGWFEFLVVINPDPARAISVHVDYQLEEPVGVAQAARSTDIAVAPASRHTISVFDPVEGVGRVYTGVAAKLTGVHRDDNSPAGFVAERPMYFVNPFDIGVVNGAHDSLGVNAPARSWYFAEGSTLQSPAPGVTEPAAGAADQLRGFQPFFTMQNPGALPAAVTVTYRTDGPATTVTRTITLPPNSRVTTDIANFYANPGYPAALGSGFAGFGTEILSDQPIVVERPIYTHRDFPDLGLLNAASDERGASDPAQTERLFAEGTMLPDFQEFLAIFNPNTAAADLDISYVVENLAAPVVKRISVAPQARITIPVFDDSQPGGLGRTIALNAAPGSAGVAVKITSRNGVGFVAERPMYFLHDFGNGVVNGAHDVLGATQADTSWFFAEGTLRPGFFEFVTVQNPNPAPTTVRLDYFIDGAPLATKSLVAPATSRITVPTFIPGAPGSLGIDPGPVDFGLRVTSVGADGHPDPTAPIVVERPIYLNVGIAGSASAINDGTDTLGYEFLPEEVPDLPDTARLAITKSVSVNNPGQPAVAGVDTEVTYTIDVSNPSGVTAVNASVLDALPPDATVIRSSPAIDSSSGTALTYTLGSLVAGANSTITLVVRYANQGTHTNTATARADNADPVSAQVSNDVSPSSDLAITKSAAASVTQNHELTYSINVTNAGPNAVLNGLTVTDTLAAGTTFVRANIPCAAAGGVVTCTIPSLAAGGTTPITLTVNPSVAGPITNTVNVGSPTFDPEPSNNTATASTLVTKPMNDISVRKDDSPDPVIDGALLTYTITVTNLGPDPADQIVVHDDIDPDLNFVSVSPGSPACQFVVSPRQVQCLLPGVLAPGQSTIVTILGRPFRQGSLDNTATVGTQTGTDDNTSNNTAVQSTEVLAGADLAITKTASANVVNQGSLFTYTLTATNTGLTLDPSDGVVVTDLLPSGVSFSTASNGCVSVAQQVTCILGTLVAGQSKALTITVSAGTLGAQVNQAGVTSTITADPDLTNNSVAITTTVVPPSANLRVTKTDNPDPVGRGSELTYTVTVTNLGPSTALGVVVTDTSDPRTDIVRLGSSIACGITAAHTVVCQTPSIAAGASDVLTLTVVPSEVSITVVPTLIENTATVTSTQTADADPSNNTVIEPTTVQVEQFNLGIDKADFPDPVLQGAVLTYTLTVTNVGPDQAPNALIQDPLPSTVDFIDAVNPYGSCGYNPGTNTVTCTIGTVVVGPSQAKQVILHVRPRVAGPITNQACVQAPGTESDTSDNCNTESTGVDAAVDLTITKTATSAVTFGQTITYDITVTNSAPSSTSGPVTLHDQLPFGLVTSSISGGCFSGPGSGNGAEVTCTVSSLGNGATFQARIVTRVTSSLACGVPAVNSVTVSSSGLPDRDLTNNRADATTTVAPCADLGITKTDDPDPVVAGAALTYTLTVFNSAGTSPGPTATVTDVLPAEVSFADATSTAGTCSAVGNLVTCTIPSLDPGDLEVVTIHVTPTAAASTAGTITNTATVGSAFTELNPADNSSTETTSVQGGADLAVSQQFTVSPGTLDLTTTATNLGPDDAAIADVTSTIRYPNVVLSLTNASVSGPISVSCPAPTATTTETITRCTSTSWFAGGTLTLVTHLEFSVTTTVTSTAVALSRSVADPNLANNLSTVVINVPPPQADLAVSQTSTVLAGHRVELTVTVTNLGPGDAHVADITGTISYSTPPSFVSGAPAISGPIAITCAPLSAGPSQALTSCTSSTWLSGGTLTLVYHLTFAAATTVTSSIEAFSRSSTDPNPANNQSTDVIPIP
jgi:uncharacterized repeat protein (TIGR01451 family)